MRPPQELIALVEQVHDQASLENLLRNGLGWELHPEFAFDAEPEISAGVTGKKCRVSSLVADSEDGKVFLVEFVEPYLRRDLRELLAALRRDERMTRRHGVSGVGDCIFIVTVPEYSGVRFVHFEHKEGTQPKIRSFGWSQGEVGRTLISVNLPALEWSKQTSWHDAWSTLAVTNEFFKTYEDFFKRWCPQIEVVTGDHRRLSADDLSEIRTHLMQRTMNRLLFITFLSKKGWLEFSHRDTRENYLSELYADWKAAPAGERFYESRLGKLFFEALAREDDRVRERLKDQVGRVPYLNGGLFERRHFERVAEGEDRATFPSGMFDELLGGNGILSAYNFTVVESYDETDQEIAVDPEMLGRIFEKLVLDRRDEGKYYTPRQVVRFMCRESLRKVLGEGFDDIIEAPNLEAKKQEASKLDGGKLRLALAILRDIKVVDPACGSGAYLLGMLHELFELVLAIELRLDQRNEAEKYQLKLEIIEKNLYGVDLDDFATNIAMLRLWLSLVVDRNENPLDQPGVDVSLPNLRFKICNGDSLSAPDPHQSLFSGPDYIRDARQLRNLHDEYFIPDARRQRPKSETEADIENCEGRLSANFQGESLPEDAFDWRVKFAEVFAPKGDHEPFLGFDIVLANPPYGVKVSDSVRYSYFDRRTEGAQSKDSYGIFMARALQLLRPGGTMCYIVSDTWRTIKSHLPLRRRLLSKTVHHFMDLPSWVFDATVNTGVLTVTNEPTPEGHSVIAADLRPIPSNDWRTLESNMAAIAHHGPDLQTLTFARYTYPQSDIATYGNCSFFIASPNLYRLMSDRRFQKLGDVADVKVGLQTGDNEYYLRKRQGLRGSYSILDESNLLTDAEIDGLSEDEKRNGVDPASFGGRHFAPYDKGGEGDAEGGWLPCYYVPTGYFIDWSRTSVNRMKTTVSERQGGNIGARFQNSQYYFVQGLTWSDAGFYSPTVRLSGKGVFDVKGSRMIVHGYENASVLGFLCSKLAKYFIKGICNHTVSTQVDDFRELCFPREQPPEFESVSVAVNTIVAKQMSDQRYPYHLHEQREIDALIYELYGLGEYDIREVTLWYCRRYRALAVAQGIVAEARERFGDHLAWCDFVLSKPPGYWSSHPLLKLIAQGEGQRLELKSTYAWDVELRQENKALRHEVFRTLAAFRNASGGDLLIGVEDNGAIFGLGKDMGHGSADEFERKLRDQIKSHMDPNPREEVEIEFIQMHEGLVAKLHAGPAPGVQYVLWPDRGGQTQHEVWIREGNRSRRLEGRERDDWIRSRA